MDWIEALGDINYWGVIAAVIAASVLGFTWYHWSVFGRAWAGHLGLTKEQADDTDGLGFTFAMSIIGTIIVVVVMAALMLATGTDTLLGGALFGAIVGFAVRYMSVIYHYGFSRLPGQLATIDGVHDIVQLAMIGAILGAIG